MVGFSYKNTERGITEFKQRSHRVSQRQESICQKIKQNRKKNSVKLCDFSV
jgi:hypothetical protein